MDSIAKMAREFAAHSVERLVAELEPIGFAIERETSPNWTDKPESSLFG